MAATSSSYAKFDVRRKNPDPERCALLVIDMQNHFSSMATPIVASINKTIQLCRESNIPIIFTRHIHKSTEDYGMLAEWWNNDLILDGTAASELMSELKRSSGDRVLEKCTYSAFQKTGLEDDLKGEGIREVIVTGVMTNLCCETTARDAFVRGFRVFFSTDATATASKELHDASLKNLAYGFAYLVDCQRLKVGLGK